MPRNKQAIFIVLLFHFFCIRHSSAQYTFLLRPYFGIGSGYCHYKIGPESNDWFNLQKYGSPFDNKQFGLLLEMRAPGRKYELMTGLTTGIASYTYNFSLGQEIDTMQGTTYTSTVVGADTRSLVLLRLPVFIKYPIILFTRNETDTINHKAYTYNHKSRLELIGGVSFNYAVTSLTSANSPALYLGNGVVNTNNTIQFMEYYNYQNRLGISINGGITWNIYSGRKKRKEIISFTLYYEQGTLNMANADLYFYKNGDVWHRQIGTRGSQIQFNVSVPIIVHKGNNTQ